MLFLAAKAFIKSVEWILRLFDGFWIPFSDPTHKLLKSLPRSRASVSFTMATKRNRLGNVLVLVPFRDNWQMTARCLESLLLQDFDHRSLVIGLIDHTSSEDATKQGVDDFLARAEGLGVAVKVLQHEGPFNFSKLNNAGVAAWDQEGIEWILMMNNDVILKTPMDLSSLLDTAIRSEAGAVGATLLYPNGRIQHLFAAPGVKIIAAHPFKGLKPKWDWEWFLAPRPVPAATGALLLVRAEAWREIGGLDEQLPTLGQDIDLCLRLYEKGWLTWVATDVVAVHHEGASRRARFPRCEVEGFYKRWEPILRTGHPMWSSGFSRWSEQPVRSWGEGPYPWWWVV